MLAELKNQRSATFREARVILDHFLHRQYRRRFSEAWYVHGICDCHTAGHSFRIGSKAALISTLCFIRRCHYQLMTLSKTMLALYESDCAG